METEDGMEKLSILYEAHLATLPRRCPLCNSGMEPESDGSDDDGGYYVNENCTNRACKYRRNVSYSKEWAERNSAQN